MDKQWLKNAQKLFLFCIIASVAFYIIAVFSKNSDTEGLAFMIVGLGFPLIIILNILILIGSLINFKTLQKVDWVYLIVSVILCILLVWAYLMFFYGPALL